ALTHHMSGQAYLLVSDGAVQVDDTLATKGDGIAISDQPSVTLSADAACEVLIIEVPGRISAR
ncbi:MAG TPA: hypothetical protein DEP10_07725, partial [Alphaproteobacteria bacterium]|nr:hypothetical protein [Alphaproteobacteria bacterium]